MNCKKILVLLICHIYILNCNGAAIKKISKKKNSKAKKPPLLTTRIVGGYVTTIQNIGGYLVAMRYNGDFFCGGSLVTERFVISAAHCVQELMNEINLLTIQGGISSLFEEGNSVGVSKVIFPSSFNQETFVNDVAILKLRKPLIGKYIQTIEFCTKQPKEGDIVMISGWGSNKSGNDHTNEVYSIEVPVISHKKCAKHYAENVEITSSMMCAGVPGLKDACQGDSGGPLVINGELCGIVSFGIGCADVDYPGVYTDVLYVLPFIQKAMDRL